MKAQYLVRFDDICPGMNWSVWSEIERACIDHQVKPLLAVVPDNKCSLLNYQTPVENSYFWEKVRAWKKMGWPIAMHGYQHLYNTSEPGILGINNYSEFAGLPKVTQEEFIKNALAEFSRNSVKVDLWIAPGHSFDHITMQVLKQQGITVISDGFYLYPFKDQNGFSWIPQQIWKFRKFPLGTWTVCFHHNNWSPSDVRDFITALKRYNFVDFANLDFRNPFSKKLLNLFFSASYRFLRRCRALIKSLPNEQ